MTRRLEVGVGYEDINTDEGMDSLFFQLAMKMRRETVVSLMAGNDTGCFTTQQYLDRYVRVAQRGEVGIMDLGLAEEHLRSLKRLVREVWPGVWTTDLLVEIG